MTPRFSHELNESIKRCTNMMEYSMDNVPIFSMKENIVEYKCTCSDGKKKIDISSLVTFGTDICPICNSSMEIGIVSDTRLKFIVDALHMFNK